MQIKRLQITNITNHVDTTIDFSEQSLFTISGTTRAGKSSIIESLFFAFTGNTHKLGAQNAGELLRKSPDVTKGEIKVWFSMADEDYFLTRSIRKSGATKAKLVGPVQSEGVEGVEKHLEKILGLKKSQFEFCLFLGQGKYDQFLKLSPGERNKQMMDVLLNLRILADMASEFKTQAKQQKALWNQQKGMVAAMQKNGEFIANKLTKHSNHYSSIWKLPSYVPNLSLDTKECHDITKALRNIDTSVQRAMHLKQSLQTCPVIENALSLDFTRKLSMLLEQYEKALTSIADHCYQRSYSRLTHQEKNDIDTLIEQMNIDRSGIDTLKQKWQKYRSILQREARYINRIKKQKEALRHATEEQQNVLHKQQLLQREKTLLSSKQQQVKQANDSLLQEIDLLQSKKIATLQSLQQSQGVLLEQCIGLIQNHQHETDSDECLVCGQSWDENIHPQYSGSNLGQQFKHVETQKNYLAVVTREISQKTTKIEQNSIQQDEYIVALEGLSKELRALNKEASKRHKKIQHLEDKITELHQLQQTLFANTPSRVPHLFTTKYQPDLLRDFETLIHLESTFEGLIANLNRQERIQVFARSNRLSLLSLTHRRRLNILQRLKKIVAQSDIEEVLLVKKQKQQLSDEEEIQKQLKYNITKLWREVVLTQPNWEGCVSIEEINLQSWLALHEALKLQKELHQKRSAYQKAVQKSQTLEKKLRLLERLGTDFSQTGRSNLRKFITQNLYTELCSFCTPFLESLFEKGCSISYNNGDFYFTRSGTTFQVKSLSGGEQFYISLVIALGIRQLLLHHSGLTLKCLFVDEGFHMLKGVELDKIVNVFQSLANQDTLVGLVTHNDHLIQAIPESLVIHPTHSPIRAEWFVKPHLQCAG